MTGTRNRRAHLSPVRIVRIAYWVAAHSRASECVEEGTTVTLDDDGGSNESNTQPGKSSPNREREREHRKTRSTVSY